MQSTAPLFGVAVANKRRFLTFFVQLQIAMSVGALVCYLMGRLIPATSSFATVYYPGAYLYTAGDVFFLVTPVVAWMMFRGSGWRHSIELAVAMIAPVAADRRARRAGRTCLSPLAHNGRLPGDVPGHARLPALPLAGTRT
jgi:hypothetical protein